MKTRQLISSLLLFAMLCGCSSVGTPSTEEKDPAPTAPTAPVVPETPESPKEPAAPAIEYESYTGEVPHIFIHALIAYPEVKDSAGLMNYDGVCINVEEFNNMLTELYNNGYCLVDIHKTFERNADNKLVMAKDLKVVRGRKPVIISVDDIVYDPRKRGGGMVDGLALDENGDVVTYTYQKDGSVTYSKDNEFVPLLEKFIAEHPDFSAEGARATLALTGFTGIFGYRTDADFEGDRNAEIAKAQIVADKLKELGYTFASHSYGHRDINKHSAASFKEDLEGMRDEVEPIVGKLTVFVYPYGKIVLPSDERYQLAQSFGFELFCSVSDFFFTREYEKGDSMYMTRIAVDGFSLRNYKTALSPLFDVDKVIDHANR